MNHYSQNTYRALQGSGNAEPSRFWFEVIMQGFKDILAGNSEAKQWLYSKDFETCCALAGAENMESSRGLIEQALRNPPRPIHQKAA